MAGGTRPVFGEGWKHAVSQRPKPLARRTILDSDCQELPASESDLGMSQNVVVPRRVAGIAGLGCDDDYVVAVMEVDDLVATR